MPPEDAERIARRNATRIAQRNALLMLGAMHRADARYERTNELTNEMAEVDEITQVADAGEKSESST